MNDREFINVEKTDINQLIPYEHPLLGMSYFFSTFPLKEVETEKLKRYSCFMVNELYLKNDLSTIIENPLSLSSINIFEEEKEEQEKEEEEQKKEQEYSKEELLSVSTIYFHEKEIQLWTIKNISHFIEI